MPQVDLAHDWTDGEIEKLEKRLARMYGEASRSMAKKLEDFPKRAAKKIEEAKQAVKDGDMTERQYRRMLKRIATHETWLRDMSASLAEECTRTNQHALQIVNDALPGVFAENANYATYQIEREARANTSFTLMDESTVRVLADEDADLLPSVKVDPKKDVKWNKQKFQSAITQGVLQGESIPKIAKRVELVVGMNKEASVRAARTACTAAENAGRYNSYARAGRLGIEVLNEWRATLDSRTRISHRHLNGERRPNEQEFSNGLLYPGDPHGPGQEVYNCRCRIVPYLVGLDYSKQDELWWRDADIEGMTYDDWIAGKMPEKEKKPAKRAKRKGATSAP